MKTIKDKYNIGLDIIEERIIAGNSTVTVNLISLLKLDKIYRDTLKNNGSITDPSINLWNEMQDKRNNLS